MVKTIVIKIKYNTFLRLKRVFPSERGETMAHYFERVAKHLEDLK